MIFNFISYLFFSAMAFGAAMALLLRVLINKQRGKIWDALSASFLIYIIIAVSLLPLGLAFSQWDRSRFSEDLIFYLSLIIVFTLLFYFFKTLTVPLVFILLLSVYLFFHSYLSDYKAFANDKVLSYRILKIGEDSLEVEIGISGEKSRFVTIGEDEIYPEIIRLDLSPYLFVLPGSRYFKEEGLSDVQGVSGIPDDSLILPSFLHNLSFAEVPPLEKQILYILELRFSDDGEITYSKAD